MVVDFGNLYGEKKSEKGIVDFNDLEHYALRILENEKSAKEYRDRFEYIFIDEYQDIILFRRQLSIILREKIIYLWWGMLNKVYIDLDWQTQHCS